MVRIRGVGDLFQENQAEDDVFVLGRVHVVPQLVGSEPQLGLEAEVCGGVLPGRFLFRSQLMLYPIPVHRAIGFAAGMQLTAFVGVSSGMSTCRTEDTLCGILSVPELPERCQTPHVAVNSPQVDDVSSDSADDAELMRRAGRGDLGAFEEIVCRHQHAVIGTAAKMLGDSHAAEDVAQMVFLRAWKSAPRYQPTAKFSTWLMTITRNLVFNETRRRGRAKSSSLSGPSSDGDGPCHEIADAGQRPAGDEVANAELARAIDAAIASLPEKARMAVVLRRYQELPYEEIAEVLGVSISAVKSLLFRARTELREKLAAFFP